jgi:Ca-activated chloride channel family protein
MSFGHPWLLLSLLVLPVVAFAYWRAQRRRQRYAVRFTNLDVLASVAGGRSWLRYAAPVLLTAALAALCIGIARPRHQTLVPREQATVILVLDVSRSMDSHDVKPSRLIAAQQAIRLFLTKVPKRVRVGLILFAGEPQEASPVTSNHALVQQALDNASYFSGFGGTAIGDALAAAVKMAQLAVPQSSTGSTIAYRPVVETPKSAVTILFLSDGHQTRGYLAPLAGALRAKQAGIPVYTIALGTPNGTLDASQFGFGPQFGGPNGGRFNVAPDPKTLHAIATTTGGKFFEARSQKAVRSAYASLGSHLGRVPGRVELTSRFVLLAAILLVLAGIASRPWVPRLP